MKWQVGETYNLRNGRSVRVLATDAPKHPGDVVQYPVITMELGLGSLHQHQADGTAPQHGFDLMPKTQKVEGWMAVKPAESDNPFNTRTSFIYKSREILKDRGYIDGRNGWHIIPVSFEVEER